MKWYYIGENSLDLSFKKKSRMNFDSTTGSDHYPTVLFSTQRAILHIEDPLDFQCSKPIQSSDDVCSLRFSYSIP